MVSVSLHLGVYHHVWEDLFVSWLLVLLYLMHMYGYLLQMVKFCSYMSEDVDLRTFVSLVIKNSVRVFITALSI